MTMIASANRRGRDELLTLVLSMHPHVIAHDGSCLYMQETWRVGATGRAAFHAPDRDLQRGERPLRVA